MSEFDDLVDPTGLSPEEEARLRRVHDLLVQAGPPAELPPTLAQTPASRPQVDALPMLPRRRVLSLALVAAAIAAIAFGGGYLLGHSKAKPASFAAVRTVPMHGSGPARALIQIAARDSVGNWPMEMEVTGLPQQTARAAYYELWLTKDHHPIDPCGSFRVHGATTSVRLTVPYDLSGIDGWVVTAQQPGSSGPGRIVLST